MEIDQLVSYGLASRQGNIWPSVCWGRQGRNHKLTGNDSNSADKLASFPSHQLSPTLILEMGQADAI